MKYSFILLLFSQRLKNVGGKPHSLLKGLTKANGRPNLAHGSWFASPPCKGTTEKFYPRSKDDFRETYQLLKASKIFQIHDFI